MNTIRRIFKNIKWAIFNHPPTTQCGFREDEIVPPCDYCNTNNHPVTKYASANLVLCSGCLKKIADSVLLATVNDN